MVQTGWVPDRLRSSQGAITEVLDELEWLLDQRRRTGHLDQDSLESCLTLLARYCTGDAPGSEHIQGLRTEQRQSRELFRQIRTGLEAFHLTGNEQWLAAVVSVARSHFDLIRHHDAP